MKDDYKTRSRFSTIVDKTLKQRFQGLSVRTRIPQSKLLDEALEMLLEKYKNK